MKRLILLGLLISLRLTAFSQIDTLGVILKNCAVEAVQLDSCRAISAYKDSITIEVFKQLEYMNETVSIYRMREGRFHEIIDNHLEIGTLQDGIIKKEKKKTRTWKLISVGLTAILVLVII